jgi:hypothetical protein
MLTVVTLHARVAAWPVPAQPQKTPEAAARYAGGQRPEGNFPKSWARRTAVAILVVGGFAVIFISGILWATSRKSGSHH